MCEIRLIKETEGRDKTMKYIDANRNWNVEKQEYKFPDTENCKAQLTECEIYQRGEYIILEHHGIIHYWELANTNYPYFQMAIEFMELENPKKWKTLDKLITLRQAIRQTEVNLCGYVESYLLDNKKMTLNKYNYFIQVSREQDLQHHGSYTF